MSKSEILIFGGTSEGRLAVKTLDEGTGGYFYSTKENYQKIDYRHGHHISGTMTCEEIKDFCRNNHIKVIIDAAHPFASELHSNIAKVSDSLKIPVIRLERNYCDLEGEGFDICENFTDAVTKLKKDGVTRLLALTGVETISRLKDYWTENTTYFRVLKREDSIRKALSYGFPESQICFYEPGGTADLIKKLQPQAIITKESGESGGFEEKIEAAKKSGVKIYVVKRPDLSPSFVNVYGQYGLRMEIEKLLPGFFPLHIGFTTGSCATAAAKAALISLLYGKQLKEIDFTIAAGERMRMDVESVSRSADSGKATVIKYSGDDPDVTNGCRITAEVRHSDSGSINFLRGKGVGVVTLPGLGVKVGEPAINPKPREMMVSELNSLYKGGLDVTISVENGETITDKTFNGRVGVEGGISIIGTSGIVQPFSHEAFIDSIRRQINIAKATGCDMIVMNSGGKSEKFMKTLYPQLPSQSFIHYGNAIGETLSEVEKSGIRKVSIATMTGKAVKLAEGNMDTHSHKVTFNKDFLTDVALKEGCSQKALKIISEINMARDLLTAFDESDKIKFFNGIVKLCHRNCKKYFGGTLHSFIISEDGEILASHS